MIRKLIDRMFTKKTAPGELPTPRIISATDHGVQPQQISAGARMVTEQLQRAGFAAFIVGGAVRDLLLGRKPKDFDIATDATPDEVHALFRRSRIIGRRFRLVHVMHGAETLEVSTFRAIADGSNGQVADEHGRILRDNVFGSQAEDAVRRDFTANALYYDPATGEIYDYLNGVADIRRRLLRIIGDPVQRYREDPVRMLRAARLAAKLGLTLEARTEKAMAGLGPLLDQVPVARLFDEMLKLMLSGHAVQSAEHLMRLGLHHQILPMLEDGMADPISARFIRQALANTDSRIREDKPVSPAFFLAALPWHEVRTEWATLQKEGVRPLPALNEAMDRIAERMVAQMSVPRRFTTVMKEIWGLQARFTARSGARPMRLLAHPRFRAGFDFLLLRCESGEVDAELGQWWETFQHADENKRRQMLLQEPEEKTRRRRRTRRRKNPASKESGV